MDASPQSPNGASLIPSGVVGGLPYMHPFLAPTPSNCRHSHEMPPGRRHEGRSSLWLIWLRKYVILCLICGGSAVFVGVLFIAIYFTLRSYTSSLQFFESIPTYVPAAMLIVTGLMVMCFAKRRNRYTYLVSIQAFRRISKHPKHLTVLKDQVQPLFSIIRRNTPNVYVLCR